MTCDNEEGRVCICKWDSIEYDPDYSDATNPEKYCCRECELKDTEDDSR